MDLAAVIIARLGLDQKAFQTGLKEAGASLQTFSASMLKLPNLGSLLSGAGLAYATSQILESAKHVQYLSERFGVSTTVIQQWGHAAEQAGSDMEAITMGFNKLEISRDRALKGDDKLIESFHSLGISANDLQKLSPDELMKKLGASSLNAADMVAILGRNGTQLKPVLEGITDGTLKLGNAISEVDVTKLAAAQELFTRFGQNLTVEAGGQLSELVGEFSSLKKIGIDSWGAIKNAATLNFRESARNAKDIFSELWKSFRSAPALTKIFGEPEAAPETAKKKASVDEDEASRLDDKVSKAKSLVNILTLQLAGETDLARALQTQLDFEEKIAQAKREGNAALVTELQNEEKITLQKEAQEGVEKRLQKVQLTLEELGKYGRGGTEGPEARTPYISTGPYAQNYGAAARKAQAEIDAARRSVLDEDISGALQHRARAQDIINQIPGLKESEKDRNSIDSSSKIQQMAQDLGKVVENTANQFVAVDN